MAEIANTASPPREAPAYRRAFFDQAVQVVVGAVMILAVAMYLLSPFLALRWLQLPFLGAFLEQTHLFNDINSREPGRWPAFDDGVQPFDRLLAINGVPVLTDEALTAELEQFSPGQVVVLTLERQVGDRFETLDLSITLRQFSSRSLLTFFLVPYGIGLIYLLIGVWVFRLRRGETAGRVFALFCAAAAIGVGGLFDIYTTRTLTWAWTLALPIAGASLMTLGLVFPQEIALVQRRPAIRLLPFLPVLGLAAYALWALYSPAADPRVYVRAWQLEYFYMGAGILFFFGVVIYRALASPSPIVQQQSRVILLGALLAFSLILVWAFQPLAGIIAPFNAGLYLPPLILFPMAVAYAILRYRLLDTDALVGQALVYAGIGILTIIAYALIITGLSLITRSMVRADNPLVLGLMVFMLVAFFNPLRERVQRVIDRTFFRGTRATTRQLEEFGRALTRAVALTEIVRALNNQIESVLRPAHFYLFLRDAADNDYAVYAESGQPPPTDLRFAPNSGLVSTLGHDRASIYLTPETPLPSALLSDRVRLAMLGSAIYAPLPGQSGLAGWLAIGPKLSGEPYSREELRFVELLADQSALAIERATVITDLQRRVKELDVLSQMSQAVNFTLAYDDLLELIYAQASKIMDTRNFRVILKDARGTSFRYAFYVENNERLNDQENQAWPIGRGLASEIVRTGQPVRTDDYLAECRRRGVPPRAKHFKAWMGVPLNAGADTIGVMSVAATDAEVVFTEEQLKVFWAIADQAASAIVKARLFQQTEQRARQLASLNEVSASMASTLELDPLLHRIIENSVDILDCEAGSLFLADIETGESVFRVAVGPVGQNLLGMRIAPGKGFVGEAVESGNALIVNDVQNDPRWFKGSDESTGFVTQALMVVPLRRGERTIGAIEVINKRDGTPFNEEDKGLLTAFAGQAAVAIENARLFTQTDQALAERVEELSIMQRIDRELNTTLDVRRVMGITLDRAMRHTGASAGWVGMVVENGISLLVTEGYGSQEGQLRGQILPIDAGIPGQVVNTGQTSRLGEVRADADYRPLLTATQSQLTLPIRRERQVIGLINLESPNPAAFNDEHEDFVTRLVDHASVAITNAQLYAEVQAANLAKSDLMDFVAHELKNPMTPIKGFVDFLLTGAVGPVNDTQKQFLGTIRNNVDRMNTIVRDLNDSALIEAGKLRLTPKAISFQGVVEDVVHTTHATLEAKQQTLTVDVPPELPAVWADPTRAAQVLTNLISNANKYTPEGGHIVLRVLKEDNFWDPDGAPEVLHVSVQDSGIGISPEDQKKLFQKFFRADDRMAREMAPGTGLGLNIVKNLVELQGGKIWFESEFRQGSTFHFTLPVAPQDEQEKASASG